MRRIVRFVATKESAFPTIKTTPYNASVTMAIQENLAVSLYIEDGFLCSIRNDAPLRTRKAASGCTSRRRVHSAAFLGFNLSAPFSYRT